MNFGSQSVALAVVSWFATVSGMTVLERDAGGRELEDAVVNVGESGLKKRKIVCNYNVLLSLFQFVCGFEMLLQSYFASLSLGLANAACRFRSQPTWKLTKPRALNRA